MSKKVYFLISFVLVLVLATGVSAQTPDDLELWAEYLFDAPDPCADTGGHGFDITELGAGATVGVLEGVTGTAYNGDIGDFNAVRCAYEHTPYATLPAGAWPGDAENGDFTIEMLLYFDEEWVTTELCGGEKSWAWFAQRNLSAGGEQWGFMQESGVRDVNGLFTIDDNLWWDGRTDMVGYVSEGLNLVKETWYHWVVSVDNTNHTIRHWIDGVPVITEMPDHSKKPSDFSGTVGDLYLGASLYDDPGGWHPFRGRIDEVRFYKGYTETYFPPLVSIVPSPKATRPGPTNGAENVSRPVTLSWTQGIFVGDVNGHEVYFGTTFAEVNDANRTTPGIFRGPNDVYSYLVDPCDPDTIKYAYDVLDTLDLGRTYFWRVDEVNEAYVPGPNEPNAPPDGRWKGTVWDFTVEGQAFNPFPTDGAKQVLRDVVLSWTAGVDANSHEVYFGTSWSNVNDANTSSDPNIYRGANDVNTWVDPCDANIVRYTYDPPEPLDLLQTCYWRIDEVNYISIRGDVWSFVTGDHFVVDDFEPYADTTALQAVWMTGHLTNNGAQLSLETVPDYIRDGDKSIEFAYRNTKVGGQYRGSEAEASIANLEKIGPDWTRGGSKALVLYFYGAASNGQEIADGYHINNDQMYVALEDGSAKVGIVKWPDMNDIQEEEWQEWNISLADPCLSDVNMADVAKVYIGFGGAKTGQSAGGAGTKSGKFDTVWFDDIGVYPTRCVTVFSYPYGDIDGDCVIGVYDLDAMSADWLERDYEVMPEEPCDVNLLVEYLFDTDYSDTAGPPYYHGQPHIAGTSVSGGSLHLDGGGFVDIPFGAANPFGGTQDFSITMWFKTTEDNGILISSSEPNDTSGCEMSMNVYLGNIKNPGGVVYDNVNIGWMGAGTLLNDGQWHHVVTTYDAETLQHHIYADGSSEAWADYDGVWDPNITDIVTHTVRIGWTYCDDALAAAAQYIGDINDVRIYDFALSHGHVLALAGRTEMQYFPLDLLANLVPKDPCDSEDPNLGSGVFDPNNVDIINFKDYGVMANNWLEGPILWPAP